MSNLTQTELGKIRKAALRSVTLSSDMKTTVVDARLKELTQDIKKLLTNKNADIEVFAFKLHMN
jgi:hypothetical protein